MENSIELTNIHPIVDGYAIETSAGDRVQITLDDLYHYMNLYTEKADCVEQFNHEIENMPDDELLQIIEDAYILRTDLFKPSPFALRTDDQDAPVPMPASDTYAFLDGEQTRDTDDHVQHEIEDMALIRKELELLTTSDDVSLQNIRAVVEKTSEMIDKVSILLYGSPCLKNLLYGHNIMRRAILQDGQMSDRTIKCSKNWLTGKITTTDILTLMRGEIVKIEAKSGKGYSIYKLYRTVK